MKKITLGLILLMAVAFFALAVVHAQSDKQAQPKKVKQRANPAQLKDEVEPVSISERAPFIGSRQGYLLVTDVLDGFGGETESDNYRIPVNSGGQPSPIGVTASDGFVVEAGFVHALHIIRGDANSDGAISAGDIVYLLNYLFRADDPPCPMEAGDANCSGAVEAGDIVYLISYLFRGGPPPTC